MIKYIYTGEEGDQEFDIDSDLVPNDSLLAIIYRNRKDKTNNIAYSSDPSLPGIIYYIQNRYQTNDENIISLLEYWGVYRSYNIIHASEMYMMTNMYRPEFINHPMNTDQYYNLEPMDTFAEDYNQFIESYTKPEGLLFYRPPFKQVPVYKEVVDKFNEISFLFNLAMDYDVSILVAGEYVLNELIGVSQYNHNVDVFFVGNTYNISVYIDAVVGELRLKYKQIHEIDERYLSYIRTKDTLSFITNRNFYRKTTNIAQIHFILGAYRTHSEVLHGFDVDCACVGWDGTDVWVTERGRFALYRGYNTINLDLASKQYERRLAKYGEKGISIYVPGLENYNIQRNNVFRYTGSYQDKLLEYDNMTMLVRQIQSKITFDVVKGDSELIDKLYDAMESIKPVEVHDSDVTKLDYVNPETLAGLSLLLHFEYNYLSGNALINPLSDYELELYDIELLPPKSSYSSYVYDLYRSNPDSDVAKRLSIVLTEQSLSGRDELPHKYNIVCNDPNTSGPIRVISRYLSVVDIVAGINIHDHVYKAMKVYGDIQLTKDVSLVTKEEGEEARTILTKTIYNKPEDWYIGVYVTHE